MELQEESEVIEGEPDRANVVDSARHDGTHPRSDGNARVVETNAQCRNTGPGGHLGERGGSRDVECDRERQSDGDGVEMDWIRCRKDGATSGPRHDSTRVETDPLAEDGTGQHRWYKHDTRDVPRPSRPPPEYHRLPANQPNPPRRRGQLKTRPRRVSYHRWTYQATRTRRGRIGRIEHAAYVAYRPEMVGERYRAAEREDESVGIGRGRARALGQRDHH